MVRTSILSIATLSLALALSACTTSSADFNAKRADGYVKEPKRLGILMDFGKDAAYKLGKNLPNKMTASLAACGVESSFDTISDLTIGPQNITLAQPDAVLIVRWSGGITSNYGMTEADYHFELTDVASKKVVWKANMKFHPGADNWADVFAQTVMKGLKGTALLPDSCAIS